MPEHAEPQTAEPPVNLKDPLIAGVLAWLVPGLGHLYQGRRVKAALLCICILGLFVWGIILSSNSEIGWGRVVYVSSRPKDLRLAYLCQIGVGLPALPALIQADRFYGGKTPYWHGFMAPPTVDPGEPGDVSSDNLYHSCPRRFELGTVYTMVAGLLNLLAIYDACCGPVPVPGGKKKEDEDEETKVKEAKSEKPA